MDISFIGGFLTPFFSSLSNILIFGILEKNRYRKTVTILIGSICVAVSTISGGLVFVFLGQEHYIGNLVLTLMVPTFICFFLLSGQRNSKTVFTALTTVFLNHLGSAPCITLAHSYGFNLVEYNLLRIVSFSILVFILYRYVGDKYRRMQSEIEKGWLIFSLLPGLTIVTIYVLMNRFSEYGTVLLNTLNILQVLLITLYAMFYYIFRQLREKYRLLERERLILMQNHFGRQLLEQQETSIEEIRHMRHDLRHHIRTALSMMEQGKISEAALMFNHLLENTEKVTLHNFCENRTANYVFSYFHEKAKAAYIELSIAASVDETCGIDQVDFGGILSNILENAVEGCLRVPAPAKRFIDISCTTENGTILIQSKNSCRRDIIFAEEMPVSSKKNGGVGTHSIVRTAEKYNGIADFSANDNVFYTRVVLHAG